MTVPARPGRTGVQVLVVGVVLNGILLPVPVSRRRPRLLRGIGLHHRRGPLVWPTPARWRSSVISRTPTGSFPSCRAAIPGRKLPHLHAARRELWSSRLLTALSGSAILVLFWLGLRRVLAPSAMLVALALLTFEVDLVMAEPYGRARDSRHAPPAGRLRALGHRTADPGPAVRGRPAAARDGRHEGHDPSHGRDLLGDRARTARG